MKVFKDIFTDNELLSDTHKIDEVDKVVYRVVGKKINISCDVDEKMFGGNKSAEAEFDEQVDSTSISEFNLVDAHQLQKAEFLTDKKTFIPYVKKLLSRVTARLKSDGMSEEELVEVKKNLSKFVKDEMVDKFKDWEFYLGEKDLDFEGLIVAMRWEEEDTIPVFYYFKHGLRGEKV